MSRCDVLLAIIGTEWAPIMHERRRDSRDDYHRAELEAALTSEMATVIPVLLSPAQIPYEEELPVSIRGIAHLQAIVVRTDPEFHPSVDKLIRSICDVVGVQSPEISPADTETVDQPDPGPNA